MAHFEFATRLNRPAVCAAVFTCVLSVPSRFTGIAGEPGPQKSAVDTALRSLVFDGPQLHESLRLRRLGTTRDLRTGVLAPSNPHISTDDAFIRAVSRGGSQGQLDGDGIHAALFARYTTGENELGFYGLEAESKTDADERETALRKIWAHNGSHGNSRVHRKDLVLLVMWHDDVSSECWQSVNATVLRKLNAPLPKGDEASKDHGGATLLE